MVRSLLANVWDGVNEMIDDTQHENLYGSYEWKHPTQVAGVPWKNPVATASGTFQYAAVHQGRLPGAMGRQSRHSYR